MVGSGCTALSAGRCKVGGRAWWRFAGGSMQRGRQGARLPLRSAARNVRHNFAPSARVGDAGTPALVGVRPAPPPLPGCRGSGAGTSAGSRDGPVGFSHASSIGGGPSRKGGGRSCFWGLGPSLRLPIEHSAFAVFLGAEFYLEALPAEATFRLSAGGFWTRLTLLMPALTLLMPGLSLTAYLQRTGRSATAATGRPPFRLAG